MEFSQRQNDISPEPSPDQKTYLRLMLVLAIAKGKNPHDGLFDAIAERCVRYPQLKNLSNHYIIAILKDSYNQLLEQDTSKYLAETVRDMRTYNQRLGAMQVAMSFSMSEGNLKNPILRVLREIQTSLKLSDIQVERVIREYL